MNEGLSQLGRQLQEIWKQLGLNQRISLVLTAGVVLAGLLGLGYWSSRVDYGLLYGKLDEAEASKVIAALDDAKIPYQARSGGSIFVPTEKVHQLRMQLAGKGIPRGEGVGFEIFDKQNFGISDFVQRANYTRAIQGELARTIGQLDQVDSARVMIVLPENRLLLDNQKKPTASVFVRVKGNGQLPVSAVNSIRFLVANSVEGLQANNVSIVDNQGNVLSENQENDSIAGLSGNQLSARRNFEQYLTKKAEGMLDKVLGSGQAVVRVSADINWDTLTRYEEKFDPENQVVRSAVINDENTESSTATSSGVPGVSANAALDATNTPPSSSSPINNRTKKKVINNQYEINRTVSSIMQSAGGLKRLSAAVFVAQKFNGTGATRKAVPRTPEEMLKLRHIVQSALGIQEVDPLRKDEIALEEMPFNDQPVVELAQQMEKQQTRQYWYDLAQRMAFPALGLGLIALFWRAFKKMRADDLSLGIPMGEFSLNGNGNGHSNGHANGNGNGHFTKAGEAAPAVMTVDVLNQLIRENPANMTHAVRSWLVRGKQPRQ